MIRIRRCQNYGVCQNCGRQQDEAHAIWEIRTSLTGQGQNTLMLCGACATSLQGAIAAVVPQGSEGN